MKITTISFDLKIFGEKFTHRLPDDQLSASLEYIDFSEVLLALDALCHYICENHIPITDSEYKQICTFNASFNQPLDYRILKCIKSLIRDHSI